MFVEYFDRIRTFLILNISDIHLILCVIYHKPFINHTINF